MAKAWYQSHPIHTHGCDMLIGYYRSSDIRARTFHISHLARNKKIHQLAGHTSRYPGYQERSGSIQSPCYRKRRGKYRCSAHPNRVERAKVVIRKPRRRGSMMQREHCSSSTTTELLQKLYCFGIAKPFVPIHSFHMFVCIYSLSFITRYSKPEKSHHWNSESHNTKHY